jgi:hypothetical protein
MFFLSKKKKDRVFIVFFSYWTKVSISSKKIKISFLLIKLKKLIQTIQPFQFLNFCFFFFILYTKVISINQEIIGLICLQIENACAKITRWCSRICALESAFDVKVK